MCKPSTHLMHPLSAPIQSSRHLLTSSLPGANEKARFPLQGINQVASVPQHLFNSLSCLESQAERIVRLGMGVLAQRFHHPPSHTPFTLFPRSNPTAFNWLKDNWGAIFSTDWDYKLLVIATVQFFRIKHHYTQKEVTNGDGTMCLINVHFKLFDWMLPLSTHLQ